jgi:hypothetical protein
VQERKDESSGSMYFSIFLGREQMECIMQNVDTIFLIGTIPLRLAWRISTCGK